MEVTVKDIVDWSGKIESRAKLPELVRRLIYETTPQPVRFNIPANEAVYLPGTDGKVISTFTTTWVPAGTSFWEMGCNNKIKSKAEDDFKKRTKDPALDRERKSASFVFVTPRIWDEKQNWLSKKNSENQWKEVIVLDATDLEAWIQASVATKIWFEKLIGKQIEGILTANEWWNNWANATKPPLIPKLLTARRNNESTNLIYELENYRSTISIKGDDREEAVAFVIASLSTQPVNHFLDKTLVLTKDVEIPLIQKSDLIVIGDGEKVKFMSKVLSENIKLIKTHHKGQTNFDATIDLSKIPRQEYINCLHEMEISRNEAIYWADETGLSIPILRRKISKVTSELRQNWIEKTDIVEKLIPFALCGKWVKNQKNCGDLDVLTAVGNTNASEITKNFEKLLELEGSPVDKEYDFGEIIFGVISQLDSLETVGYRITVEHLRNYFEQIYAILSEHDPAVDISEENWWEKVELYNSKKYSEKIAIGICESLCILAVYGERICGDRLRYDIIEKIESVVSSLIDSADSKRLLSIRCYLTYLAEASPDIFLECIESDIWSNSSEIKPLIGHGGNLFNEISFHDELLWALEILAWHSLYFDRVLKILLRIKSFEPKDINGKSIQHTLNNLFRVELPCTEVSVKDRLSVLRNNKQHNQITVMEICKSLLPHGLARFGSQTRTPKWRRLREQPDVPTKEDLNFSIVEAKKILFDMNQYNMEELQLLLEIIFDLEEEQLNQLIQFVERWLLDVTDETQQEELCKSLRKCTKTLKHLEIGDKSLYWRTIDRIEQLIKPSSLLTQHKWLFDEYYLDWELLVSTERISRPENQEVMELHQSIRSKAIEEIIVNCGEGAILELISTVNYPETIATILSVKESEYDRKLYWIEKVLSELNKDSTEFLESAVKFIHEFIKFLDNEGHEMSGIVERLSKKGDLNDSAKKNVMVRALPPEPKFWEIVKNLGRDAEKIYWNSISLFPSLDFSSDELEYAVKNLLSVGRAIEAFAFAGPQNEKLKPKYWKRILEIIYQSNTLDKLAYENLYYLSDVYKCLDEDTEICDSEIAELEYPLILNLTLADRLSEDRVMACHRLILSDPKYLQQLLIWCYKRNDGTEDRELRGIPTEDLEKKADLAYHILANWNFLHVEIETGKLDEVKFKNWIEQAVKLVKQVDRVDVFESHLARVFAQFANQTSDDIWLPDAILEYLDKHENNFIREEFYKAIYNSRGTVIKNYGEGGDQERQLARNYERLATDIESKFPRVSRILKKRARKLGIEAKYEDDGVKLLDRWRPR